MSFGFGGFSNDNGNHGNGNGSGGTTNTSATTSAKKPLPQPGVFDNHGSSSVAAKRVHHVPRAPAYAPEPVAAAFTSPPNLGGSSATTERGKTIGRAASRATTSDILGISESSMWTPPSNTSSSSSTLPAPPSYSVSGAASAGLTLVKAPSHGNLAEMAKRGHPGASLLAGDGAFPSFPSFDTPHHPPADSRPTSGVFRMTKDGPVLDGAPSATTRAIPSSGTFKMTKDGPVLISSSSHANVTTTAGVSTGTIRRPPTDPHHHHSHHTSIDHSSTSSSSLSSSSVTAPYRPESGRWDAAKLAAAKREAKTHAAAIAATASLTQTEWVERQLELRSKEFTDDKKITLMAASWNVNGKKPQNERKGLSSWLCMKPAPDIYIVGFQEIVDLNAKSLVVDHGATKLWEEKIDETLRPLAANYVLLGSVHMVGLSLSLYVKRSLEKVVSDVRVATCGVGIGGVMGNKGAVAIRFTIFDSTVCILNSHLAAHQKNVKGRNSDFHNICKKLVLPLPAAKDNPELNVRWPPFRVADHDYVWWIGDLNYRINLTSLNQVFQLVEKQNWPKLLAQDQLLLEKAAGNAFANYSEGPITFAPTYKYKTGTDQYERREDRKKRFPAWCDRIQWITHDDIKQLFYRRAELTLSDHKPVMSLFEFKAKMVVKERRTKLFEHLRTLKKVEVTPTLEVSPTFVMFSDMRFEAPVTQTVRITNPTQVAIEYRLYYLQTDDETDSENLPLPGWLIIKPQKGVLQPKTNLDVPITVNITRDTASPFFVLPSINSVIMLHVTGGKDYPIMLGVNYLKSVFGSSLDYLRRLPATVPIRNAAYSQVVTSGHRSDVPLTLLRIIQYIVTNNGMHINGLFPRFGTSVPSPFPRGSRHHTSRHTDTRDERLMLARTTTPPSSTATYNPHATAKRGFGTGATATAAAAMSSVRSATASFTAGVRPAHAPTPLDLSMFSAPLEASSHASHVTNSATIGGGHHLHVTGHLPLAHSQSFSLGGSHHVASSSHHLPRPPNAPPPLVGLSPLPTTPHASSSTSGSHSPGGALALPNSHLVLPRSISDPSLRSCDPSIGRAPHPPSSVPPSSSLAGYPTSSPSLSPIPSPIPSPVASRSPSPSQTDGTTSSRASISSQSSVTGTNNNGNGTAAASAVAAGSMTTSPLSSFSSSSSMISNTSPQSSFTMAPSTASTSSGATTPTGTSSSHMNSNSNSTSGTSSGASSMVFDSSFFNDAPTKLTDSSSLSSSPASSSLSSITSGTVPSLVRSSSTPIASASSSPSSSQLAAPVAISSSIASILATSNNHASSPSSITSITSANSPSPPGISSMAITVSSPSPPLSTLPSSPASHQSMTLLAPIGVPIVGMEQSISSPCSVTSSWCTLSQTSLPYTWRVLEEMKLVGEWLDTKCDFQAPIIITAPNSAAPAFGVEAMARSLIRLFESLSTPVLASIADLPYMMGMDLTSWCMRALLELPPAHYKTLVYLCSFLREVLRHRAVNGSTADDLAIAFSGALMQRPHNRPISDVMPLSPSQVVKHLLISPDFASHPST